MKEVIAIIEKGRDGLYAVRSEYKIGRSFLGGFGDNVEEAKEDFESSIDDAIEDAEKSGLTYIEKNRLKIVYKYDMPSFFNYFDFINVSKFASYIGINESKLRQYKTGRSFPGEKTTLKILTAVGRIGNELINVRL